MALSATTLKAAIKARMTSELGMNLSSEFNKSSAFVDIICEEIITHIKTNAVVSSSVAVASVSGVTTGVGVSGPGTGTATGTIT